MKRWMGMGSIVLALVLAVGCSQDSARNREEQEKAQRQLDVAKDKLRQGLKQADEQTREDLDKARTQVRQALSQSERDAERAREKLREREEQNNPR
jgi:TfoX/Sxy family transcriptional regulator of competence genes